jgi:hypothetical protein
LLIINELAARLDINPRVAWGIVPRGNVDNWLASKFGYVRRLPEPQDGEV